MPLLTLKLALLVNEVSTMIGPHIHRVQTPLGSIPMIRLNPPATAGGTDLTPTTRLPVTVRLVPRLPAAIKMDLYLFQRGHSLFNLVVDEGKKPLELFARVHDLKDNRQVLRQSLDLERMQPSVRAKAHHSAQHRGPGQTFFPGLENKPFV